MNVASEMQPHDGSTGDADTTLHAQLPYIGDLELGGVGDVVSRT